MKKFRVTDSYGGCDTVVSAESFSAAADKIGIVPMPATWYGDTVQHNVFTIEDVETGETVDNYVIL